MLLRFETPIGGKRRIDWVRWLLVMGVGKLRPAGALSFAHYDQVLQAAIDGSGVSPGRLPLVAPHLRDGVLVAPFPRRRVVAGAWHVVVAPAAAEHKAVRAFVGWLHDEAVKP